LKFSVSVHIVLLVIIPLFIGCSPGRKLATRFVTSQGNINILLLPPSGIIKKLVNADPSAVHPDSIVILPIEESTLLSELNDTAFVNYYFRSLRYHLEQFRVNVFGPWNLDAFFALDTIGFMFSTVQMELLEYSDKFEDYYTSLDENNYIVQLPRRNLELSTWIEYSELNNPLRPMEVLYSMQSSSDYFEGRFVYYFIGGVSYSHRSYYLEAHDMYDLAYYAGLTNAQYIFDHLMNLYVADNLGRPRRTPVYYQYDVNQYTIRRTGTDRFIRMTQP